MSIHIIQTLCPNNTTRWLSNHTLSFLVWKMIPAISQATMEHRLKRRIALCKTGNSDLNFTQTFNSITFCHRQEVQEINSRVKQLYFNIKRELRAHERCRFLQRRELRAHWCYSFVITWSSQLFCTLRNF